MLQVLPASRCLNPPNTQLSTKCTVGIGWPGVGQARHIRFINRVGDPSSDFPEGQEEQLELYLSHFSLHIFIGEAQVNPRRVDIFVAQLLLERVKAATVVQEVYGIPMAEKMGVYVALKVGLPRGLPDNLVCPLLGDMPTLSRCEQVIDSFQSLFLGVEQNRTVRWTHH